MLYKSIKNWNLVFFSVGCDEKNFTRLHYRKQTCFSFGLKEIIKYFQNENIKKSHRGLYI